MLVTEFSKDFRIMEKLQLDSEELADYYEKYEKYIEDKFDPS